MSAARFVTDFLPLTVIGFAVGAAAGFAWSKNAKSKIGESVTTDVSGGVVTVRLDTVEAARSGLGDNINRFLDGVF